MLALQEPTIDGRGTCNCIAGFLITSVRELKINGDSRSASPVLWAGCSCKYGWHISLFYFHAEQAVSFSGEPSTHLAADCFIPVWQKTDNLV